MMEDSKKSAVQVNFNGYPLSPRAYFAALAMQGLLANHVSVSAMIAISGNESDLIINTTKLAVTYADALLAALKEGE